MHAYANIRMLKRRSHATGMACQPAQASSARAYTRKPEFGTAHWEEAVKFITTAQFCSLFRRNSVKEEAQKSNTGKQRKARQRRREGKREGRQGKTGREKAGKRPGKNPNKKRQGMFFRQDTSPGRRGVYKAEVKESKEQCTKLIEKARRACSRGVPGGLALWEFNQCLSRVGRKKPCWETRQQRLSVLSPLF